MFLYLRRLPLSRYPSLSHVFYYLYLSLYLPPILVPTFDKFRLVSLSFRSLLISLRLFTLSFSHLFPYPSLFLPTFSRLSPPHPSPSFPHPFPYPPSPIPPTAFGEKVRPMVRGPWDTHINTNTDRHRYS